MNPDEFLAVQKCFAQRLSCLNSLTHEQRQIPIDRLVQAVEDALNANQEYERLLVREQRHDRPLRDEMIGRSHPLIDIPTSTIFQGHNRPPAHRYEIIALLMQSCGFPAELILHGREFDNRRFRSASTGFNGAHLNKQLISCRARRLLSDRTIPWMDRLYMKGGSTNEDLQIETE